MVKVASWNIRGLNLVSKRKEVKRLIIENGLDVCSIVKTKVCSGKLKAICDEVFGNWSWVSNNSVCEGRTRIIMGWDPGKVKIIFSGFYEQVVHSQIYHIKSKRISIVPFCMMLMMLLEGGCYGSISKGIKDW